MKLARLSVSAALVGLCSVARASSLLDGLVDHYDFNGNLLDTSGNGFNLTPGGTFEYVRDRFGVLDSAVKLEFKNPDNGTFFLGTGPELANESSSVSFWIRRDYAGDESWVFGLGHPAGTGGQLGEDMHIFDSGGLLGYSFFYEDLNGPIPFGVGTWNNITATYDHDTGVRDVYVNGSLYLTDVTDTPFTGGDAFKLGYQGSSLDDFRFYDRVLTADEAEELGSGGGIGNVPDTGATMGMLAMGLVGVVGMGRRK